MSGSRAEAGKIQDELDHFSQKERKERKKKKGRGDREEKRGHIKRSQLRELPKAKRE